MGFPGDTALDQAVEDLVYRNDRPEDRVAQHRRVSRALADVVRERIRQEEIGAKKRLAGIDWRSCADPEIAGGELARYAVLGEEVGEVANAILEAGYASTSETLEAAWIVRLRAELVQVAAVSLAWIESMDARSGR